MHLLNTPFVKGRYIIPLPSIHIFEISAHPRHNIQIPASKSDGSNKDNNIILIITKQIVIVK